MDLLVSHQQGRYGKAKREILEALRCLGDEHPLIERTDVDGIAFVRTTRDGRRVVRGCRELLQRGFAFEEAVKWVPIDYWCEADLDTLRRLLVETVRDRIAPEETRGMKIAKRRWQRYHTRDIVLQLAGAIDRKVDLDHPDKLVRVDVVGREASVSVLGLGDVFSIAASKELHPRAA